MRGNMFLKLYGSTIYIGRSQRHVAFFINALFWEPNDTRNIINLMVEAFLLQKE